MKESRRHLEALRNALQRLSVQDAEISVREMQHGRGFSVMVPSEMSERVELRVYPTLTGADLIFRETEKAILSVERVPLLGTRNGYRWRDTEYSSAEALARTLVHDLRGWRSPREGGS